MRALPRFGARLPQCPRRRLTSESSPSGRLRPRCVVSARGLSHNSALQGPEPGLTPRLRPTRRGATPRRGGAFLNHPRSHYQGVFTDHQSNAQARRGARSDARWGDPREYGERVRDDERPRVYEGRDGDDRDPRDSLMHDLDLPRGEERELVVDRDGVYELNGEDSRTAPGARNPTAGARGPTGTDPLRAASTGLRYGLRAR